MIARFMFFYKPGVTSADPEAGSRSVRGARRSAEGEAARVRAEGAAGADAADPEAPAAGEAEAGAGIGRRRAGSRREEEEVTLLVGFERGARAAEGRATRGLKTSPSASTR